MGTHAFTYSGNDGNGNDELRLRSKGHVQYVYGLAVPRTSFVNMETIQGDAKSFGLPALPPHNNDNQRDIWGMVKRRNISGSTKSAGGKAFRDGLMTLKQTCFILDISLFGFMKEWFRIEPTNLAEIIKDGYQTPLNPTT